MLTLELDIYGELMDAIYLYNKYGKPISWQMWTKVRDICDYVANNWDQADMSIWEVRSRKMVSDKLINLTAEFCVFQNYAVGVSRPWTSTF